MVANKTETWIDKFQDVVDGYNNSPHSALVGGKFSPNQINETNANLVEEYMRTKLRHYPKIRMNEKQRFFVGDYVAISTKRPDFTKG